MRTFQVTYLLGRLGQDPELRYTADGQAMAKFSLATDRPAKPGAEPDAEWHQVVCWQQPAEFAGKYLGRGRLVFVVGRLNYRVWEDKDGQKRRTTEIVASEVIALDRRPEPDLHVVDSGDDTADLPF